MKVCNLHTVIMSFHCSIHVSSFLLCFTVKYTYISWFVYIFHYSEKYNCYARVSITLTSFCTPAYFNKRNLTFIKMGTNDINMTMSWRYCFLRFKVFGCFSLKETENLLNVWRKIKLKNILYIFVKGLCTYNYLHLNYLSLMQ